MKAKVEKICSHGCNVFINHQATMGLDMNSGTVADKKDLGIMESYKSKSSSLCAAAEAAEQVIRVDDIIRCAQRQRQG